MTGGVLNHYLYVKTHHYVTQREQTNTSLSGYKSTRGTVVSVFFSKTAAIVWTLNVAQRPCVKLDASLWQYWEVVKLPEDGT